MKSVMVTLVSSLLLAAMLLAPACAPKGTSIPPTTPPAASSVSPQATPLETEAKGTVKLSLKKLDGTVVEKQVEKPRYGGVLTWAASTTILGFDDAYRMNVQCTANFFTHEEPLTGDFTRGPSGTGEWAMLRSSEPRMNQAPLLAESWEWPDQTTMILHMRKGVHFALNPNSPASRLANGREVNAEDLAFSLLRMWNNPRSPQAMFCPYDQAVESIVARDKWTLVVKSKPGWFSRVWLRVSDCIFVIPVEVAKQYDLQDWRNSVGTGPFILKDYVVDSAATFVRNPNYWRKHPLFAQDTMPYLDGVKMLIIPDMSTRLAALRTGKVDTLGLEEFTLDDANSLRQTNPELRWREYLTENNPAMYMRVDLPPFSDVRVRRALSMAIDREAIRDQFYKGKAEIFNWPVEQILTQWFLPLQQYPQSARELFEYHPDKAKQLLAEAGYPNGFKTTITTLDRYVDRDSILVADWAKIGVNAEIQVKEYAVYTSMMVGAKRTYPGLASSGTMSEAPYEYMALRTGLPVNAGNINDPVIDKYFEDVTAAFFDKTKEARLIKESSPYIVDQAYLIMLPTPYVYMFWQPWLKLYSGERRVGLWSGAVEYFYGWIDQDLREKMTGLR